jgi:hypothetical protein
VADVAEVPSVFKFRKETPPAEPEIEVAGIGTLPSLKLLIAAAVVSLVVIGVTMLFFVLFRPMEEEATVEIPTEEKPVEVPPVEEPTV